MNGFERVGRKAKVWRLVAEMDRLLRAVNLDPYAQGGAIASALEALWGPTEWANVALAAGVREPSAITIAAVLDVYRERCPGRRVAS